MGALTRPVTPRPPGQLNGKPSPAGLSGKKNIIRKPRFAPWVGYMGYMGYMGYIGYMGYMGWVIAVLPSD